MDNITAKVSCFARAYHSMNYKVKVFDDTQAVKILGSDYEAIAQSMIQGIDFFLPDFKGTPEKGLELIVDRHLSPSVLGRSAYCEKMLEVETRLGCRQYVIFASGYDTFGMRNTNEELKIYELDLPELLEDKNRRIEKAGLKSRSVQIPCNLADETWKEKLTESGFRSELKSFCSLLGISCYLEKGAFERLVGNISTMVPRGSSMFFDYPEAGERGMAEGDIDVDINVDINKKNDINSRLAAGAGEEMISSYSYDELVRMLEKYGFKIYEHLNDDEMTDQFFMEFNIHNRSHHISAPKGVSYCYAVKWR